MTQTRNRPGVASGAVQKVGETAANVPTSEYLRGWLDGYMCGGERSYRDGFRRGFQIGRLELAAEQNGARPSKKVLVFGTWFDQAAERQKWDDETRRLVAEAAR